MKVIMMNLCFLLPEGFEGGFNDALSAIIEYRKSKEYSAMPEKVKNSSFSLKPDDDVWREFLRTVKEGKRLYGGLFVGELKDEKWVRIENGAERNTAVSESKKYKHLAQCNCPVCGGSGWASVNQWHKAVDVGHKAIMTEHKREADDKADQEHKDISELVVLHHMVIDTLATKWQEICNKHETHAVDAGVFGHIMGGMTVAYFASMEDELKIERHQVFARFVNGMLHYMETRGDTKGVGIVAGQSKECQDGIKAMATLKDDKEMMN